MLKQNRASLVIALVLPALSQEVLAQVLVPFSQACPVLALARREAASGRLEAALRLLEPFQKGLEGGCEESIPPEAALFEAATLLHRAGRLREAEVLYRRLEDGILSDEALFQLGSALLRAGEVEAARATLGRVSRNSARFVEARTALSTALVREGRAALAVTALRELLALDLVARDLCRVRMALARALAASGDAEMAHDQALDAYLHADKDRAADEAARILEELGHPVRRLHKLLRWAVLGDLRSLKSVIRPGARRAIQALDLGAWDLLNGVYFLKARRDASVAVRAFERARSLAQDPIVRAWATWGLGEALVRANDDRGAIETYRALRSEFPGRILAARSAVAEAKAYIRLREVDRADQVLAEVEQHGRLSGLDLQVLWLRALSALMTANPERALVHLDEAQRRLGSGDGVLFGLAERVRYFRGVALVEVGRRDEGVREIRRVARGFPHSYYGVLAVMRLRQLGQDWSVPPAPPGDVRSRGPVLLWRLGERATALAEMRARAHQGHLHEPDLKYLGVMLAQGQPERIAMSAQRYLRGLPDADDQWLFEAAYPRPYRSVVAEVAREVGIDEALVHAVMRAESAFDPSARSPAGAVGLMQVMPATARIVARTLLGNARLAAALWDSRVNVRLGVRFLAELQEHFRGHPPLVLAGYNAGPGAARRFHERLRDLPTDVFVEAIPYSQTQAYVKRVIALASGYRVVYGDPAQGPLEVPLTVPDSLGPFMEPRRKAPLATLWP